MLTVTTFADFFSSMALLSLLAWSYGYIRRTLRSQPMTQVVLGATFGMIAYLQMHAPLELGPGLIVDLRTVPVILAGAYLGWRGAATCLLLAVAARAGIGGQGTEAAIAGLVLAAVIGLVWGALSGEGGRRGPVLLALLGAAGGLRLVSLLLLPPDAIAAIITVMVPVILPLEIFAIVIIGLLLEREGAGIAGEARLRAAATTDPATGLTTLAGLRRVSDDLRAIDAPGRGNGLLLLRLREDAIPYRTRRAGYLPRLYRTLCRRAEAALPEGTHAALAPGGEVVILLPDHTARMQASVRDRLLHGIAGDPVELSDGSEVMLAIDVGEAWDRRHRPLRAQMHEAVTSLRDRSEAMTTFGLDGVDADSDRLFARAARLLA